MISMRFVPLILLMLACTFIYAQGATHDVTNNDELAAAIAAATAGDVIRMAGGVYTPGGPLAIPNGVTIEGGWNADFSSRDVEGNLTTIDGQGGHALLVSNGTTEWTIDGLTLTGGVTQPGEVEEAGNGSVLRVTGGGSGMLRNMTVVANDASKGTSSHGTAIWITDAGSALIIEGSVFMANIDADSSTSGMISAVNDASLLHIEDCLFQDNDVYGGLIHAGVANEFVVTKSTIEFNRTNLHFLRPEAIDNTITECIIRNNEVVDTGQDFLFAATDPALALVIENTVFEENIALRTIIRATLPINALDNVSIVRNTSVTGRALDMRREESLNFVTNSLIENHTAQNESMINMRGGENELINTVIRGNVNTDPGDQVLHVRGGYFKMERTIIEDNASNKAEFLTLRSKEVLIYDSIIRNNQVPSEMVEVRPDVDTRFEMINTVLYNNNVAGSYPVRLRAVGPSSILNCTIVNNISGPSTINAERDGSEYFVINNIFSGNTASDGNNPLINTAPQIEFEAKHNLVWDWEGKVNAWEPTGLFLPDVDGNFEGDPMFVDVAGGDLRLQEGSAAIDAGMTLDNVTADIAGIERPQGAAYDIGAYEYVGLNVTTTAQLLSAIATATPGDVIPVAAGTYTPGGPLEIPNGVTIEGGWDTDFSSRDVEANVTVIDGQGEHALLVSNGTTEWVVGGLTLTGGITQPGLEEEAGNGSVLRVTGGGSGMLRNVIVTANDVAPGASAHGTAIWVTDAGSSLIIEESSFTDNFDTDGNSVAAMLSVLNDATLFKLVDCALTDNVISGGILWAGASDELVITNSVFESNTTNLHFLRPEAIENTITECIFKNNEVVNTGQDFLFAGTDPGLALVIENTVFEENVAPRNMIRATLLENSLDNVSIVRNTSSDKGRVLDMSRGGALNSVINSLIENNTSQNESLINMRGGENEIINTVIRGNVNTEPGDQLLHVRGGYFKMEKVIIEDNASSQSEFLTLRSKEVLIYDSIIRNNQVPAEMVEVRPDVDTRFEMINTIIYNNNVAGTYPVRLRAAGPSSILNCTIVNNVSGASTINAEREGSEYLIINNIFSGNTASDGNASLINTADQIEFEAKHNLVWDWEGKISAWEPTGLFLPDVDGNIEGDPMFVDVDDGDLHLQEGSTAIDAGMTLDNVTADIAGVERPQGAAYDIGAYEYVDPVSVIDVAELIPQQYELSQNYPNPFNPTTTIAFGLPEQAQVTLDVYNVLGQRIRTLVGGDTYQAGYYQVVWDGRDQFGNSVSSGIYIYRLTAGEFNELRKMVFIK